MQGKRIVLKQYPTGMPGHDDLVAEDFAVSSPAEGEVLLRTIYLSLDPYMRGRMSPAKSYAARVELGEVMTGEAVSQVVESGHADFAPGEFVRGHSGWQTHAVMPGNAVVKVDPSIAPISTALGVMGMPGFTAYSGLKVHGMPKPGETVVVSAAAGAVGQIVGQLAKIWGCRAVGIAGGKTKCDLVTDEFGFDACVDYKADDFADALKQACPDGVDIYFENVGGDVLKTVLPLMNDFGRIPVCGLIAWYNLSGAPSGEDSMPALMRIILVKRLRVHGFINYDHAELRPEFDREMAAWIGDGNIKYLEDIVQGVDNAVDAFQGLMTGRYTGKVLVQLGEDPTK